MQEHSKDKSYKFTLFILKLSSNTMLIKHYVNENQKAKQIIKQDLCRSVSILFAIYQCSSIWY